MIPLISAFQGVGLLALSNSGTFQNFFFMFKGVSSKNCANSVTYEVFWVEGDVRME